MHYRFCCLLLWNKRLFYSLDGSIGNILLYSNNAAQDCRSLGSAQGPPLPFHARRLIELITCNEKLSREHVASTAAPVYESFFSEQVRANNAYLISSPFHQTTSYSQAPQRQPLSTPPGRGHNDNCFVIVVPSSVEPSTTSLYLLRRNPTAFDDVLDVSWLLNSSRKTNTLKSPRKTAIVCDLQSPAALSLSSC